MVPLSLTFFSEIRRLWDTLARWQRHEELGELLRQSEDAQKMQKVKHAPPPAYTNQAGALERGWPRG